MSVLKESHQIFQIIKNMKYNIVTSFLMDLFLFFYEFVAEWF